MTSRQASIGILVFALVARVAHVLTIRDYPLFDVLPLDSESYDTWARQIVAGEWMRGRPFYQAPLYAYFLAALHWITGGDLLAPRLANALLGTVTVALVIRLGGRTFGAWTGVLAGLLCAVHGTFLFEEGKVMKTTLGVALATGCLVALVEARLRTGWRWAALAGVLGGLAALVRENFLLVLMAVVAWAVWRRARGQALAILAGAAVVILPATFHNASYDGEFLPITSQAGQNFYTGMHPGNSYGGYLVPEFVRRSPRFEEIDFAAEAERRAGRALTPGQTSRYWMREGWRGVADNPLRFGRLFVTKLGLLYHHFEIPDDEDVRFFRRWAPVLRWPWLPFGPIACLGLLGLGWSLVRRRAPPELLVLVGVYTVSVAMFFVFSRYRLLLVGPLSVFAAFAILEAVRLARARQGRSLLLGAMAVALIGGLVYRPLEVPASFENSHLSVGIALEVKGKTEAALAEYEAGVALAPNHAKLLRRSARLLFERDAARGAALQPATLDRLERAVRANPEDVELRWKLGVGRAAAGDAVAAVQAFQEILDLGEEPPGIHFNRALAYEQLGRWEEARAAADLAARRNPSDPAVAELRERLYSP